MAGASSNNEVYSDIHEIVELKNQGKSYLRFKDTDVKYHAQPGIRGELKLSIHKPTADPSLDLLEPLSELHMSAISECHENLEAAKSDHSSSHLPFLCLPPHHSQSMECIPRAVICEKIGNREIRWGSALISRGEISFLPKFWEWSSWVQKLLLKKNLRQLASAVSSATKDYHRPNSIYRALCEVWCPETNTFVTASGEIGISLWDIREVSGLPIMGNYYEEVVPSLSELTDHLPKSCLYLFNVFALIANANESDCVSHEEWINFWFHESGCAQNPRQNKNYKNAMNLNPFKRRHQKASQEIRRPVIVDKPRDIFRRDRGHWGDLPICLSVEEEEELEIAAYFSLWLCRFVLPSGDEYMRVGTFKASSKMAGGYTYSLVPPVLASIYRGLTRTSNHQSNPDLGSISHSFPGHFLYAWAATYFVRGIYAHVDKSYPRPIIRRYAGTLNAFQSWEKNVVDCRDLIRGMMDAHDFCWNPFPSSSHPGARVDDVPRSIDTSEFMVSIRSGFVSYRRGNSPFILEAYNPHRFARQLGFRQKLPGSPRKLDIAPNAGDMYRVWLSLTRTLSGSTFHIPEYVKDTRQNVDAEYQNWWSDQVSSILTKVQVHVLSSSENRDFILGPAPNRVVAKRLSSPNIISEETSRKRDPDFRNERVIKKIKIIVPSTRFASTSEPADKIPEVVLIPDHSSPGDRASHAPGKTLTLEDESSGDQAPLSRIYNIRQSVKPMPLQAVPNPSKGDVETSQVNISLPNTPPDGEFLNMSPRTRNAGFPSIPEGLNFSMNPNSLQDQIGENDERIDALQGIDGAYDFHDPPCKYPSIINEDILAFNIDKFRDEDEVNSETVGANISEINHEVTVAPSSLALVNIPPSETNNRRAAPICSFMSGPPPKITQESPYLKAALHDAMINYLQKCFRDVLKHGFSNIRSWWSENNLILQNVIANSFHTDPTHLMKHMDVFLTEVDHYLSERNQHLECLTTEEKTEQLKLLNIQLEVKDSTCSSLENKIGQLSFELDKLRDELQTQQEQKGMLGTMKATLEESQTRDVTSIASIDRKRKTLEDSFLMMSDFENL